MSFNDSRFFSSLCSLYSLPLSLSSALSGPLVSTGIYIYIYIYKLRRSTPPPSGDIYVVVFLLSLGGFPLGERKHMCSAIWEVYEAGTLPAETPHQK